ncbi:hypothetical protein CHGG_03491 [Chaetomium globosum CBS 148.51]|uniref:Carrier domain-containing protein n=1 Tax=Chaetomium globosum (strain ATCC 6205 / CBS 148.51 / DSM 1962 / NBRC 6347 / NRRL 1970) TaxID=306901 RepID=Q2H8G3_CHAGB|nr:uncharacterized protein CHGG_03491 [Chaetomium globosum CBS 148.51]EAQ91556.1 hypothetical protein CHGG_03491 [Chaetomium globosum CBS 148.51]
MHLIHQRDADAFLGDPFASVPDLFDELKLPYASSFSDIENEFEATRVQADIAGETIQWLTSEIRLPSYGANLQNIVNAWNTLAAHPHITVAAGKENGLHLRLHFRRALIDATSLDYIKFDLFLLLGGLPPQEHIGFPTYARFLRQTKDCGSSREFWATTLDGTVIRPALLPREFAGQATARPRTSVTTIVATTHLGGDNAGIPRQILLELLWAYVLSLHAEADEVVFGTVRRDGSFFGSDSCIGCLDQTYLVRLKLSGEDTIGDAAAALEAYHDAASPHAFVGLNDMRTRVPQQVPVEAVLNYTRSANPQCIAPGLKQFPLVLTVCDAGGPGLKLMLNYITDIPNAEAELLLEHLATAIESVSAKTDLASVTLEDIELVSVAEEAELLRPPPFAGDPSPPTLPDLIEAAVSRHPERTAVQFGEEVSLTYGELNALANGLAKTLKLRRGDIVPLLMDRSADLSVAMLAILKSGASYTVMGTDMPYERNARIVVECNAAIVLADKKYAPTEFPSAKTLNIEDLLHEARAYATQANNLAEHGIERPHPSDRCYIIYTSGSTGKPKGTMITHLAAANGITHHTPITHIPRTLLFYSPTASAAQRTFNSVLIHGGTIILAPKSHLATDLASVINTLSVDAVEITPTALALLQPSDVPHLKQVTIAGERIPEPLVNQWASSTNPNTPTPTLIVRNRYGSSECTQMSHGLRLLPGENPRVLGEPQDTTLACVLRPGTTRLAPLGVPGELCLAGPQLAEGYLKEEGLTKKVFVQSPGWVVRCVDAGGGGGGGGGGLYGKMYRTGDKVRRLPGGGIEMLGRIDWQAKINGTKVEPADVDRALGGHPDVAAVATVAAEVEEGRLALVTAVVLSKGRSWADVLASLRQFALKALPPFMVPGFWLPVPELPRSMNGKVDFHALRRKACELGTPGLSQFLVAPTVATNDAAEKPAIGMERDIARVWAAVLGLDETFVRRHHSFLSLGGNSLLAIKAVGQLRKAGLVTDFADLIADKPLVEVALCVSRASTSKASQDTEEIPPFSLLGAGSTEFGERVQKDLGMELEDAYPATALQEGVLATLGQEGDSYTYRRVWNVEGLDHARLKKSFQRVVAERGIYKTSFIPQGRSLIQAVRRGFEAPWQEWHGSLEEYLEHDRSLALSLSGPLFRIGLIEGRYLVTTTHHALCDFWSHKLLYQDVAAVYLGNEPPTRSKFSNFIGYLLDQDPAPAREFWASYLQGSPRSVINYSPVTEATVTTRRVALDLQQTTLGSIVYTAWAIVLSFHLGSHDVSFATAVSGREVPVLGIADMDGPTLTTVPQRVKLNDQTKTLGDLVKDVRASFVQVAKHSQVGLRGALQAGGLDPGSIDSLINVLVKNEEPDFVREVFKPYGKRPLWNSGPLTVLEVEELGNAPESATSTTIEIRLSGTAEAQRLEFIMDSFVKVATTILQSPDQPVSSVDVLGDTERGYLLNTLSNRETLVEPPPQLLHARFEEQAETTPDAIAIDWEGTEQVTYGELDRRANKMSRLFVQIGVQPGDVVALMLDKSIDAVVAILGVLKAGAAYTPLSPENPSERNSLIINESQAKVLVIHQQHADFAHHHHPSPTSPTPLHTIVLNTTTAQTWLASQPPTNPHIFTTPTLLAYLLYTSGSTGQPKGIQVPHASAAAAVGSMIIAEGRHPPLSPSTLPWRTLQFASLVFDASVQDLFNTLSTGGTLCMAATDRLLSDLGGCARALGARQAILTPTVAGLLRPEEVPGLEVLVVGGEPLTEMVVRRWGRRCRVVNVYGPTETCMVGGGEGGGGWDGGGWWTGDLVRWLPGGELECLGRKDNQVHIHGYRVELGEIEAAVRASGLVKDTTVVLVEVNQTPQIAAFCTFIEGGAITPDAAVFIHRADQHQEAMRTLKDVLGHSLPPYMVPHVVLPISDFPKLPSRKVDRKALKKMVEEMSGAAIYPYVLSSTAGTGHTAVPVQNDEEGLLESMWAEVLGIPEQTSIGREANFRSLGGDSISAISLASLARQRGFALSVPDILRHRTLKDLATTMDKLEVELEPFEKPIFETSESVKSLLVTRGLSWDQDVDYVYPCPPGQTEFLKQGARDEQMWVLNTVRRMSASIDQDQWIAATEALAQANDILRTTWVKVPDTETWVGVVLRDVKLTLLRVEGQEEDEISEMINEVYTYRFTSPEPFIRYVMITYPDKTWDLVIKMDHAVYDGTLLRILDDHFNAILCSTEIPKHVLFKDFAFAVFEANKSRSLRYWAAKLSRSEITQYNEPATNTVAPWLKAPAPCSTGLLRQPLPATQADTLEQLAANLGVTPSSIFQAAFQLWLWQTAGGHTHGTTHQPIAFDYLVSGRSLPGTIAAAPPRRPTNHQRAPYLFHTHDDFWAATDHGDVGLDEMYAAAGLCRAEVGSRVLFLFQPFTPAPAVADDDPNGGLNFRWLVMAKSRVRMFQPYALVVEVAKAVGGGHNLAMFYDEGIFERAEVEGMAGKMGEMVERVVAACGGKGVATVGDLVGES